MLRALTALSFAACSTVSARAQSNVRPLPRAAGPSDWAFEALDVAREGDAEAVSDASFLDLELLGFHAPSSDLTDAEGALGVDRAGWNARLGSFDGGASAFALDLRTEASFYSFDGATGVVPGASEPFNDVYSTSVGGSLVVRAAERASLFAGVELALAGEDETSAGEALTVGGLLGARWRASESASLSFGLAARSRLEDDAWLWPFLGFDVRVGERLRLSAEGPRARAELELSPRWSLFGDAVFDLRQYRLNDDGPLPSGVARDEEIDVSIGVSWRPADEVEVRLSGGVVAWHELTMLDRGGALVSESEADPTWFGGVSIAFGVPSSPWRTRGLPAR